MCIRDSLPPLPPSLPIPASSPALPRLQMLPGRPGGPLQWFSSWCTLAWRCDVGHQHSPPNRAALRAIKWCTLGPPQVVHTGAFPVTCRMKIPSVHQLGPAPSPQCAPPVCTIPCVHHQAFPVCTTWPSQCAPSPVCTTTRPLSGPFRIHEGPNDFGSKPGWAHASPSSPARSHAGDARGAGGRPGQHRAGQTQPAGPRRGARGL